MQKTKLNSEYSYWEETMSGVPQGSILGSLLLNKFLCDVFLIMENINIASYTDDNKPHDDAPQEIQLRKQFKN